MNELLEDNDLQCLAVTEAPRVEYISTIPAVVEHSEPVVAVNISDFLDPPSFDWTKSDSRAADAARTFGEDVYADH